MMLNEYDVKKDKKVSMKRFDLSYIFGLYLLVFVSISMYAEYGHITFISPYFIQSQDREAKNDRPYRESSGDKGYDHHHRFAHNFHFNNYTIHDFRNHFVSRGCTESEILNQPCLYMFDEFVKYAQTYPGYKNKIREMYAELKKLTCWQKVYYAVKGSYCRKLQKRIQGLYVSLDAIKEELPIKGYYNVADIAENAFHPTISEHFAEYEKLESVHQSYMSNLAKAINARSIIYKNGLDGNSCLQKINKSYNIASNIKQLLSYTGYDINAFTQCYGNQLQQAIHQESLDILNHVDNLRANSILYDHQEALIDLTVSMVEYNHADMPDKAMQVADLCWTLLDYGQAIAEGAALGLYSAAHDILTNPIEATISIVAGKQVLAFQLCKVLYNVADIGATAITNFDAAQEKWNKYAEPLNNIIDAINKKEIAVRDAIKGGTAFVVGYKAQGKLLGGLGKLCNTIKHKSINFVKNNQLLNPQEYLITPEGLLFKATVQSKKAPVNSVGNLKSTVEKLAGTVWKNIKATDKMYPGTKIPKSFELAIGKQKFWVAPNATKHMLEYLQDTNGTHKKIITHNMPINCQALLSSMQLAVERAISSGVKYDTMIKIGCWEFRFGMPREEGLLPSIYHANFKPKNW